MPLTLTPKAVGSLTGAALAPGTLTIAARLRRRSALASTSTLVSTTLLASDFASPAPLTAGTLTLVPR